MKLKLRGERMPSSAARETQTAFGSVQEAQSRVQTASSSVQGASSLVREGQKGFDSARETQSRAQEGSSRVQKGFDSAREASSRVQTVFGSVQEAQTAFDSAQGTQSRVQEAQTGRSMVEMLGVLAVIGVLSIGGIAGYTQAMSYYKANEIVDTIAKLDVVVQTACARKSKEESPINVDFTDLDIKGPVAGCATNIIVNKETCRYIHVNATIEGCQNETRLVNTLKSLLAHRMGQNPYFGPNGEIIVSFREDR